MPLALRRFQDCWQSSNSITAVQSATKKVGTEYAQLFPCGSHVVRVSRLCEMLGIGMTGLRSQLRYKGHYLAADPLLPRPGHSGTVRFSRKHAPFIAIPEGVDGYRARVSVAHEISHVLIHRRGDTYDDVTTKLPSSREEEALAEYGARLLLLPSEPERIENLAEHAVRWARYAEVTVHAAACRLGDPDQNLPPLRGLVLWKINPKIPTTATIAERLTPAWHLCPGAFVPIGRCKARPDSLVAELAMASGSAAGIVAEDVRIGSLLGCFKVHAFAWGSLLSGTRLVLSVFEAEFSEAGRGFAEQHRGVQFGSGATHSKQPYLSDGWF
jgi:uncharacterized protein DUF955